MDAHGIEPSRALFDRFLEGSIGVDVVILRHVGGAGLLPADDEVERRVLLLELVDDPHGRTAGNPEDGGRLLELQVLEEELRDRQVVALFSTVSRCADCRDSGIRIRYIHGPVLPRESAYSNALRPKTEGNSIVSSRMNVGAIVRPLDSSRSGAEEEIDRSRNAPRR